MNYLYIILIGVVVFVIIRRVMEKVQEDTQKNSGLILQQTIKDFGLENSEAMKKFKLNIGTIVGYMAAGNNRVTVSEIEKLLGVSSTEAEKYMNELARNTILTKKDETGRIVFDKFK